MITPKLQKQRIIEYLKEGKRLDGRKPDEYRKIEVTIGISNQAEGSCSVKFGKTEVYAGVKLGISEPYSDGPDEGTFMATAELSPMASPDFEMGPPGIKAIELGRIIDRGIRESGLIDFKKLCIEEGKKVWSVYLDLYAVNDDGNLIDVAALAALIALANAKLPVYNEKEEKIEHKLSKTPLPLNKDALAFNITLHKIGDTIIADPSREEEEISDARMSIAISDNDGEIRITSVQKGKDIPLSTDEMEKIFSMIEDKSKELVPALLKYVWGK